MKVFISWSGPLSESIALALREWLPKVIQAVDPWMSKVDIGAGALWWHHITVELEGSDVGIVCVTRQALNSRWLNFEAGALAKHVGTSKIIPYLIDLQAADVTGPLVAFQMASATKSGTIDVIRALNGALSDRRRLPAEVEETFELWWPRLETKIDEALSAHQATQGDSAASQRSTPDMVVEILNILRNQQRSDPDSTDLNFAITELSAAWRDFEQVMIRDDAQPTLKQMAHDDLRRRMRQLLLAFYPAQILDWYMGQSGHLDRLFHLHQSSGTNPLTRGETDLT